MGMQDLVVTVHMLAISLPDAAPAMAMLAIAAVVMPVTLVEGASEGGIAGLLPLIIFALSCHSLIPTVSVQ